MTTKDLYYVHVHVFLVTLAFTCTVVSRVSAHGLLNITRDFGPHGRSTCIEAATVAP